MKLIDFQISDDILKIVQEEVARILAAPERDAADMLILEKATKIYSLIQSNVREAVKAGMMGDVPDNELPTLPYSDEEGSE